MTAHLHQSLRSTGKSDVGWFRPTNQRVRLDENDAYLAFSCFPVLVLFIKLYVISPIHKCLYLSNMKAEEVYDSFILRNFIKIFKLTELNKVKAEFAW